MLQQGASTVPKFGSFKPKTSSNEVAVTKPQATKDQYQGEHIDRSHRSHGRRGDRREDRHRHRRSKYEDDGTARESRHGSRHEKKRSPSPAIVQGDEPEESNLFLIDRRGDPKNVEYGSLHKYSVPSYHRTGYGHVIGTAPDLKVDRDESTEKEIVLISDSGCGRKRPERLLTSKRRNIESRTMRLAVPTAAAKFESELDDDFLAFRPALKRKRASKAPSPEVPGVDYRSIEGKANAPQRPADEDLQFICDSDVEATQEDLEVKLQQKSATLFKKATDDPLNIDVWMDLIQYQATVVNPGGDNQNLRNSKRQTLAEIRLSIYERGLKHILTDKVGHDKLLLGLLEEASFVWEISKLELRWQEALKECPASNLLWIKYLDFVQTSASFTYERCKEAYMQCMGILQTAFENAAEPERAEIAQFQAYVLLRYTTFVRDAGYEELALAIWQIMLEYHHFKPEGLIGKEAELESLEAFWESDVPRIGEQGAEGWNHHASPAEKTARSSSTRINPHFESQDSFSTLVEQEIQCMTSLQLPAAVNDDVDTDDPYRYVMFSDLREVVESSVNNVSREVLLNAFLLFMHLPLLPVENDASATATWQSDTFLRTDLVDLALREDSRTFVQPNHCSLDSYQTTTFLLFYDAFRNFHGRMEALGENGDAEIRFVERVLEKLVLVDPNNDALAEYYLACKLQMHPLEVTKVTKRLLKKSPSSLRLYNAYALAEARLDRITRAREIWIMAANMVKDCGPAQVADAILLSCSGMLTSIYLGNELEAMACLLRMLDGPVSTQIYQDGVSGVSTAQRLRISQLLDEGLDTMVLKSKLDSAVLYAECRACVIYLLEGHNLEQVFAVLEKSEISLAKTSSKVALELLHQAQARMIGWHMRERRSYKPGLLRQELAKSIHDFPDNSIFLKLHTEIGRQTRIDDRLRDAIQSSAVQHEHGDLVQIFLALKEEMRRCSTTAPGSTQNSVRALFQTSLLGLSSRVKHSSTLWVLWFHFEIQAHSATKTAASRSQKLRQVFFDGLRALPWCKFWIILGIRYYEQIELSRLETYQLHSLLAERGLRIRYDVNDLAT